MWKVFIPGAFGVITSTYHSPLETLSSQTSHFYGEVHHLCRRVVFCWHNLRGFSWLEVVAVVAAAACNCICCCCCCRSNCCSCSHDEQRYISTNSEQRCAVASRHSSTRTHKSAQTCIMSCDREAASSADRLRHWCLLRCVHLRTLQQVLGATLSSRVHQDSKIK